jgi:hypothetical protein
MRETGETLRADSPAPADAAPITAPQPARAQVPWRDLLLILLGGALTLAIYGYRFGEGNHTIYLLDALRGTDAQLLRNDWFATQTLQYHAVFGWITRILFRLELVEPVFLATYALLVLLFHVAWLGIAKHVIPGAAVAPAYLLSLALYYVSAAGTGLGFYQFFQDSSVLPSNIANLAMLWGLYLWMTRRFIGSGVAFGIAGLFHLNHAVVGVVAWVALILFDAYADKALSRITGRGGAIASVLALLPAMTNILLAARVKIERSGSMPLAEFVDLYVRLRHPHHYDPPSWPIWLWVAFAWPIPMALLGMPDPARRRVASVIAFMLVLQVIALLGAGVWFASETLVQLSLYRFSIFAQLLMCILAAAWVVRHVRSQRAVAAVSTAMCIAMILACLWRGPFFGAFRMPEDDADYLALCDWAGVNTPVDAVFLVPPGESSFRLRARRAIIVNFKAVPQLSGELLAWRDRLCDVLDLSDLRALPRGYAHTLVAIDDRYHDLPDERLLVTARAYDARFVVTTRPLRILPRDAAIFSSPNQQYFLYDLANTGGNQ